MLPELIFYNTISFLYILYEQKLVKYLIFYSATKFDKTLVLKVHNFNLFVCKVMKLR